MNNLLINSIKVMIGRFGSSKLLDRSSSNQICPKKGFTLIELMVAITIVAVISAIGYISYSSAQISSRDAKRKQDLRSLATALEVYHQANGRYPCTGGVAQVSNNIFKDQLNQWLQDTCGIGGTTYMDQRYINKMPRDPLKDAGDPFTATNNNNVPTGFSYRTLTTTDGPNCPSDDGQYYILASGLENPNDPDLAKVNGAVTFCDGSIPKNSRMYIIVTP